MINKVLGSPISNQVLQSTAPSNNPSQNFAELLKDAINEVNRQQVESEQLSQKLVTGEVQDIHQVMIASQKASISLSLAIQVRNKVVEAYQEIMRMPL
jgi:flagellar hook-basal body complex protein FliE